jgi:hypothetical protein
MIWMSCGVRDGNNFNISSIFLSLQLAQNKFSLPFNANQGSMETTPSLPYIPSMYDITDVILPPSFVPRSKLSPTIPVAPLPVGLEELIDADAEGSNMRWISALPRFFLLKILQSKRSSQKYREAPPYGPSWPMRLEALPWKH